MKNLARLLGYVRAERGALALAFACMAALALTTGAYAWLAGPMVRFLVTGDQGEVGKAFSFVPALASLDRGRALLVLPLALVAVGLVKGVAYFGQFHLMGMVGQRVVARVRRDYFARVLEKDFGFFGGAQTGDLVSRFTSDIAHVERAVTYAIASYVRDTLSLLVLLAIAFALNWRLSLIAFVAVPLVAWPIARLARKLKRRAGQGQESLGKLTGLVQEGLWGSKVIQAYRMEARELSRFDAENARCLRAETKAAKVRALAPAVIELASVGGLALAIKLAAEAVNAGATSPEELMSFLVAVALVLQPAKDLGRASQFVLTALASAERLFAVMDGAPAVKPAPQAPALPPLERHLGFEGVRFAYRERPVLDGFELEVGRGEVVALVGESGAGKSTAALLAMRFADPAAGAVKVDGRDLREAELKSVRRQSGLVTQEPLLFSGTVFENIAYGRRGATPEEVERAAGLAQADGFVRALPEGYQTLIGERGARLSGGQKQRIALARALVAQAPMLLLDEATSNLDAESEREVTEALKGALADRTALVIAHRLSTIRDAHRIAVVKGGRIVEQGRHEELLARGGEYARLYRREGAD